MKNDKDYTGILWLIILLLFMGLWEGCAHVPEFAHECAGMYELEENVKSCEIKSERNAVRRESYRVYKEREAAMIMYCREHDALFACRTNGPGRPRLDRDCGCISRAQYRRLLEGW